MIAAVPTAKTHEEEENFQAKKVVLTEKESIMSNQD